MHPPRALENPFVDVTVSFCRAILPRCSHINYLKKNAVCIRELFERSAPKQFSLIGNDQHGRTKILDPSLSIALCHSLSSLVQNRNTQLVQSAPTHHVAENDSGTVWRLSLKKVHTKGFIEAKGPRQRCWESGFWRMRFGYTCWTLELSSHTVENLRSGTTETKRPQEFLLARVSTIVMDILSDLFLARRQWFPDNCLTVAAIRSHREETFRPSPSPQLHCRLDQVHAALSLSERNKPRSNLSGQTIVSLDVSMASGL